MTEAKENPPEQPEAAIGDYVPYGFGHPAHRPDPNATYVFEERDWRPLPIKPERRWRVPG